MVVPRERAGTNDLDAAWAKGAASPTEEAARRIRCSFSFRDRRAIRRGVGDHVAAPRQGHTGRRRRENYDPMIRKIRSAVAILLQIRLNLSMLSQDKDTRVVRVPVEYRLMLTASLPHPLRHIPGLRRPPMLRRRRRAPPGP